MKRFIIGLLIVLVCPLLLWGIIALTNNGQVNDLIKLDMSNAKWNYEDNFEIVPQEFWPNGQKPIFKVEVVGLPKEITATFEDNTATAAGEYLATVRLGYDQTKYELLHDRLPRTLKWKVYDNFFIDDCLTNEGSVSESSRWLGGYIRSGISSIHFVNYLDSEKVEQTSEFLKTDGGDCPLYYWGTTEEGVSSSVYIGFDGSKYKNIKFPKDSSYYFAFMTNLEEITGLEYVDTSYVTNMRCMFYKTGEYSRDLKLDLNFNTIKVEDMSYMFSHLNSLILTLNLGENFDTSNVINMKSMFSSCGTNSVNFVLELGDKFYTKNVTNMQEMFSSCGSSTRNSIFYLNLGENFDISNVTNTVNMFMKCGYHSSVVNGWDLNFIGNLKEDCDATGMFYSFGLQGLSIYVNSEQTFNKIKNSTETFLSDDVVVNLI